MMNNELENRQVLIVEDDFSENSAVISGALGRLIAALSEKHIDTLEVASPCEALPVVDNNMDIDAFLVAVDMQNPDNTPQVHTLLNHIKELRIVFNSRSCVVSSLRKTVSVNVEPCAALFNYTKLNAKLNKLARF